MSKGYRVFVKQHEAVEGKLFELSESFLLAGMVNAKILTFGLQRNEVCHQGSFVAVNRAKPLVLALSGVSASNVGFYQLNAPFVEEHDGRMLTYKQLQSETFLIECGGAKKHGRNHSQPEPFWSVRVKSEFFVAMEDGVNTADFDMQNHSQVDIDQLCAFVNGDIDVRALRIHAIRRRREMKRPDWMLRELEAVRRTYDVLYRRWSSVYGAIVWAKFDKRATAAKRFQNDLLSKH